MKKNSQLFLTFICFLSFLISNAQNSLKQQTIKINILHIDAHAFPKVSVSFKANDKNKIPFWNLNNDKMLLTEDGKRCIPVTLRTKANSQPICVSIVVDHSGSMDEDHAQLYDKDGHPLYTIDKDDNMVVPDDYVSPIENAKKSIQKFTSSFDTHKDLISITGFGTVVDKSLPLTNKDNLIDQAVENLKAEGKTALYDGIVQGIAQLKNAKGIKVLVVLTDGEDNTSKSNAQNVIDLAVKENIPVYIIGLGDVNKIALNEISEATNGLFLYTRSAITLQGIYTMISQRIQATYELEYTSPNKDINKYNRELELSAGINNCDVINDKGTYQLPEQNIASVMPTTSQNNDGEVGTNIVKETNIANGQKSPNPKVDTQASSYNEKGFFWIFGNIILACLIAAFIIIYKRRKQESKVVA